MSPVPTELLAIIVDYLYDDWRSLVACVGTDSDLLSCPAIHHLSQTVDVNHYTSGTLSSDLLEFLQTFRSEPDLQPLLRSLHIHGSPDDFPSGTFPAFVDFAHFQNLRSLALSYLLIDLPQRFCRVICNISALEDLSLYGLARVLSPPGRYRSIPDTPPARGGAAALRARLRVLRIGASAACHGLYSAIAALLGRDSPHGEDQLTLRVFEVHFHDAPRSEEWLKMICTPSRRARGLTRLGATVVSPVDEQPDTIDSYSSFRHMSYCRALESLSIRYCPVYDHHIFENHVQHGGSHMHFVRFLAQFLSSVDEPCSEPSPRFPALKKFTLLLRGPAMELLHEHLETEPFSVLATSLGHSLYPQLRQITIVIEATLSVSRNSTRSDVSPGEAEMWDDYMSAVEVALSPLTDEGVTIRAEYQYV
ncbi:hypothetical protein OH76DRAFT_1490474 [Lentinus brumalis]|uniref:F-box domain-containing protein n=1 Tax=Lentinus brumalis TaxID=2498619 RepID=A0A371CIW4_9APHY|nr:hypothetical protein OH76DRAFT_1490474 [Polyporus brumalis]